MRKIWKQGTIVIMLLLSVFIFKLDVNAEKIWNKTGEKTPSGRDFTYKYWSGWSWTYCGDGTTDLDLVDISYEVMYDYEEAYKMLKYVNELRREAGVQELIVKDDLMDVAMQRAAEINMFFDHIRPDGSDFCSLSYLIYSENICSGGNGAADVTNRFKNSPGHYENMMDPSYKYVGFGCANGSWVQVFAIEDIYYEDGFDYKNPENNKPVRWDKMTSGQRKNCIDIFTAKINPAFYEIRFCLGARGANSVETAYVGETLELTVDLIGKSARFGKMYTEINSDEYEVTFDRKLSVIDTKVPTMYRHWRQTLKCMEYGKTTVTVSLDGYPQLKTSKEFTIRNPIVTKSGHQYKITKNSETKRTVSFLKAGNVTSVAIPKTIKIDGASYKVTKIEDKAFKNNKTVKKVQIGSNITTIGKEAFRNCNKLKNITVKSTKIKTVGKNAFKGIHKKAIVKVPKSKLKKYKALFKGKGQKKTVKIKKYR